MLDYERNEIIQQAADIDLTKQRKLRVDGEEISNKRRQVTDVKSEDEEESDYTSTEEVDFSFDED